MIGCKVDAIWVSTGLAALVSKRQPRDGVGKLHYLLPSPSICELVNRQVIYQHIMEGLFYNVKYG